MNSVCDDSKAAFTSYVSSEFTLDDDKLSSKKETGSASPRSINLEDILIHDQKKIKHFIRSHHWPANHEIRRVLWLRVCEKVHGVQNPNIHTYDETIKEIFGEGRVYCLY